MASRKFTITCGWHPISVGQPWSKEIAYRHVWIRENFSGSFFLLLHCSLWEQKSLAKVMVKRELLGGSLLYHLLLIIYDDHCGAHHNASIDFYDVCALWREAWHYSWLYIFELAPVLGHSSHPGIPLHSWSSYEVPSPFFFVRSLILLALLPFNETCLSRLSLRENALGEYLEMLHVENTFILPWLGNRILGWK